MTTRIALALVALAVVAAPRARAGEAATDAKLLVEQGALHEEKGELEVAAALYKAACLEAPADAEAHRREAHALVLLHRCAEATAELHAYLDLAPAAAKAKAEYADAVVALATCLAEVQATIAVRPSADARCAIDHGAPVAAGPAVPASFTVAPGAHEISCLAEGQPPATTTVQVAAKEQKSVALELEPPLPPPPLPTMAPTPAPIPAPAPAPVAPSTPAATPGAGSIPAPIAVPPPSAGSIPAPIAVPPPSAGSIPAPIAVPPPSTGSAPAVAATPVPARAPVTAPTSGELRIEAHEGGWTCRVDRGAPVAFDPSDAASVEVTAGHHVVDCERAGSQPLRAAVEVPVAGARTVRIKPYPLPGATHAPVQATSPDGAPTPPVPTAPEGPPPPPPISVNPAGWEWRLATGFGAGLGTFGIGAGARYGALEGMVGTGLYPLALTMSYLWNPGGTGAYVSAGYVLVGEGALGGGSEKTGTGLWAGGGVDDRFDPHWSVRLGAGFGWNSAGSSTGPLVLDLSLAYLP